MITSQHCVPPTGRKVVCLTSGGLDSTVVLSLAVKNHGPENVVPIIFDYGQTHRKEIFQAQQICSILNLGEYIQSSLFALREIDSQLVSVDGYDQTKSTRASREQGLPPSFVPGRNIAMLAIAASIAYSHNAPYIYGGWNAIDYSGYPDCRPDFLWNMEKAIDSGLDLTIEIVAPLTTLKKSEIIRLGVALNAPLHMTWSCYKGEPEPCGECDSCIIRSQGFEEAGLKDPALAEGD